MKPARIPNLDSVVVAISLSDYFNSLVTGVVAVILKIYFPNSLHRKATWATAVELSQNLTDKKSTLVQVFFSRMSTSHRANVDPDLRGYMASLGQCGLICDMWLFIQKAAEQQAVYHSMLIWQIADFVPTYLFMSRKQYEKNTNTNIFHRGPTSGK